MYIDRVEGNIFVPVTSGLLITLVACAPPDQKWRANAIGYSVSPPLDRSRLLDPPGVPFGQDFLQTGLIAPPSTPRQPGSERPWGPLRHPHAAVHGCIASIHDLTRHDRGSVNYSGRLAR